MAKTMKKDEIGPFLKRLNDEFERQLNMLGARCKKKTKEDLIAGFKDGARSALNVLRDEGFVDVVDTTKEVTNG